MDNKKYILSDNEKEESDSFQEKVLEKIRILEISIKLLKEEVSNITSALSEGDKSFFEKFDVPGRAYDEDWYTNHGHGD